MKDSVFKNVLVNLRTAFLINIKKRINANTGRIAVLEDILGGMNVDKKEKKLLSDLLAYYAGHQDEAGPYLKELSFLVEYGKYCNFPYKKKAGSYYVESGYDDELNLPFVIHNGNRLYFPTSFSVGKAVEFYSNYIWTERLLGLDHEEGAPHQYQSLSFRVEEGDVLFDVGAAEGLFALDNIIKASHVVIVECDSQWLVPLRHTFAPFGDKVTIIEKYVSAIDTDNAMSLKRLLSDVDYRSAFVKMDIEGYELPAIVSAAEVLKRKTGTKIAAASYHRQHDAEELKAFFDEIDYTSVFSDGFMLFRLYDDPVPPYFRKGVIRAKSKICK